MSIKDRLQRKKVILEKRAARKELFRVKKKIQELIDSGNPSKVEIRGTLEFVDGREEVRVIGQCYIDENQQIWVLTESNELVKFIATESQRNAIVELMEHQRRAMEELEDQERIYTTMLGD